jgi:hypothetical protein
MILFLATPEAIAALTIATGSSTISLGSNGFGIMYSGPNSVALPFYSAISLMF